MPIRSKAERLKKQYIKHAVECANCGNQTYMYERDCHHCGINRWECDEE